MSIVTYNQQSTNVLKVINDNANSQIIKVQKLA